MENYTSLSDLQTKTNHDAILSLQGHHQAVDNLAPYSGWMYFKKVGAREYLFHAIDRRNNGKSMGARSPETEAKLAQWLSAKAVAEAAFERATQALEQQKRFCKAARLGRLHKTAAKLLRLLDKAGVSDRFIVLGTHALYAYEAMAGVHFSADLTATMDFDILWDSRLKMTFATDDESVGGLMGMLKKVDKTFTRNTERTFQAINADGFAVEILRPNEPREPALIAPGDQIAPIHLAGMEFLLGAGILAETVIAEDGYPLLMRVPDPAAYVLHKLWVSERPDRRKDKAGRDVKQAMALASLIRERIPFYGFEVDRIQGFAPELLEYLDRVLTQPATNS